MGGTDSNEVDVLNEEVNSVPLMDLSSGFTRYVAFSKHFQCSSQTSSKHEM